MSKTTDVIFEPNKIVVTFKKLIKKGFNLFISNQIEQFSDCKEIPLHFIGSIGFYLKDELKVVLLSKNMNIGKVLRKPNDGLVNITIYDMMGRIVKTLVNGSQTAGFKSVQWNATNDKNEPVSAGLYLYTIQAGEFRQTKKMVLLK